MFVIEYYFMIIMSPNPNTYINIIKYIIQEGSARSGIKTIICYSTLDFALAYTKVICNIWETGVKQTFGNMFI